MKENIDSWTSDDFVDIVERTLIALHETRPNRELKSPYLAPISMANISAMQKCGAFVPAPDRIFLMPRTDAERFNDGVYQFLTLPKSGCVSTGAYTNTNVLNTTKSIESYCRLTYFRQLRNPPPGWVCMDSEGVPYELVSTWPQSKGGVAGAIDYLTVNQSKGCIVPCIRTKFIGRSGRLNALSNRLSQMYMPTDLSLGMAIQSAEDMEHQWRITAKEGDAKVVVGAYAENVKSLLYARSLPMTPTGRKRPIMHLVSAHRRRLKEGTEIDISTFLRGSREVVMDNMVYTVDAPERLIREYLLKNP